jgi:hypothetical protein
MDYSVPVIGFYRCFRISCGNSLLVFFLPQYRFTGFDSNTTLQTDKSWIYKISLWYWSLSFTPWSATLIWLLPFDFTPCLMFCVHLADRFLSYFMKTAWFIIGSWTYHCTWMKTVGVTYSQNWKFLHLPMHDAKPHLFSEKSSPFILLHLFNWSELIQLRFRCTSCQHLLDIHDTAFDSKFYWLCCESGSFLNYTPTI